MNATELAQKFGVDESVVESILSIADQEGVAHTTEVEGFVSCINQGCQDIVDADGTVVQPGMLGVDRPVRLRREWVQQTYKDLGGDLAFTDRSTEHYSLVDDSDLTCPSCGEPCALLPGKRRKVPKSQYTVQGV